MINLDTTQPDEVIPLNLEEGKPPVPSTVAATRATKAAYGLDGLLTYDDIYNGIVSGSEDSTRRLAAAKVNDKKRQDLAGFVLQTDLSPDKIAAKFNSNPSSVFEDEYASKFYDGFLNYPGGNVEDLAGGTFSQAAKENPEGVSKVLDINKDLLSFRELVHNRYIDAVNAQEQQSFGGRAVDFLKDISGYTNLYTLRQNGKFWLEDQRSAFAHMDHSERVETFNKTMDYLIEHNPGAAITYADYMGDPSYLKSVGDIAFTALDTAAVVSALGKGVKGLHGVLFQREVKRMADEVLARSPLADGTAPVKAVAEDAVGHPVEAGKVRMEAEVLKDLQGSTDPTQQMVDGITAALRPTGNIHSESPTNIGAEAMNRLRQSFTDSGQKIVDTVLKMSRVLRVNDTLATKAVIDKAYQEIIDRYPGTSGNVVGLMPIKHDPISNKLTVDVVLMRNDATPFASVEEASAWAGKNSIIINNVHGIPLNTQSTGASILPTGVFSQGKGFYIAVTRPLNETTSFFRDAIIQTEKALDKNTGFLNRIGLGGWRTGSEVLSVKDMTDRQVSIYGPSLLKEVIARIESPTALARSKLRGQNIYDVLKNWKEGSQFQEMLLDAQKAQKDFKDVTELNHYYQTKFNRLPSETEVQGYFSYIQGKKIDYIFRNLALHTSMSRQGGEQHQLIRTLKDGTTSKSKSFVAVAHKEMTSIDDNVLIQNGEDFKVRRLDNYLGSKEGKEANDLVKKGELQFSELYDPDNSGLSEFSGQTRRVQYVLSKRMDRRPLDFLQLPEKEGGHLEYPYEFYLKEAKIQSDIEGGSTVKSTRLKAGKATWANKDVDLPIEVLDEVPNKGPDGKLYQKVRYDGKDTYVPFDEITGTKVEFTTKEGGLINHYYKGDTTIMALESRAIGKDAQAGMEAIKKAWREGDMAAAQAAATKLGIGWPEITRKFKSGALDPNQPTHIVPRGKTVGDVYDFDSLNVPGVSKFKDTTRGGSLARQFQVEFTGERDAYNVYAMHNEGTIWQPLLSYRPADTVDPFTSINRSLTRIVDSTYMQDVKIASVEGWVQRAKGLLQATAQEIRDNPYAVFRSAEFKRGLVNTPEVNQLEAERYQIKAFAGIPSQLDSWLHSLSLSLQDSIYGGSNALTRASAKVTRWSFDKAVTFPSFMRAVTYRADIGLFNPAQLWVQLNTYTTIAGMSGFAKAGQGAFGALLHLYSKMPQVNEEILQGLDKMAQKVGYRPGEWLELRSHLSNSGFEYVGKETNQIMSDAHMYSDKIYTSTKGNFLDAGEIFFKGGERFSRYGAWFTSGKEWRDTNPTRTLGLADRNSILNRADDLMGNMTKASRSSLQTGLLSAPSQFLGYQLRIMELMTGKRLSIADKARMYAVYGAAYGLPVAAGLQSVFPFTESIKRYAMEHGYVENESKIVDIAFQGIPAMMLKLISGHWYDVGERYGSPGFNVINDALAGDKSFWQVAGGASGNLVMDTWKKLDPFYKMAISHVKGDNVFNMTGADLVQLAKSINIVKTGWQISTALNSMEWLSKNENPMLEDVSPSQAYFIGITGLQPLQLSKSQQYYQAHANQEEKEKTAEQGYVLEWRRGLRDLRNKDPVSATQHFRNADATLVFYGYPQARRDALFAKANDRQTLPEKEAWNYWVGGKDIPAGDEAYRAQVYGRILRSQQKENQ